MDFVSPYALGMDYILFWAITRKCFSTSSRLGHTVLRTLAHYGPLCLAKQWSYYFLLHEKLCFQDLIQCWGTEARFGFTYSSLVAQRLKYLPGMRDTQVQSLDQEDPLEKEMATHSSTLAWRIPWSEEPGRLQSMGCKESDTTATSLTLNPKDFWAKERAQPGCHQGKSFQISQQSHRRAQLR